jgi:hypothetical protein
MRRPPPSDPLEFDPTAPEPAGGGDPPDTLVAALPLERAGERFADPTRVVPEPEPRPRALRLDFSEVRGLEQGSRASDRAGAARIDPAAFLSRADRAAMERAQSLPRGSLPSLIERDERSAGVRVVHVNRRFWLHLALGVVIPAVLVAAGVFGLSRYRAAAMERQVEALRRSDAIHRQLEDARQNQIAR